MELFILYLWLKLDNVLGIFVVAGIVLGAWALGRMFHYATEGLADYDHYWGNKFRREASSELKAKGIVMPDTKDVYAGFIYRLIAYKKLTLKLAIASATLLTLPAVLPSQKDTAILVGAHYALKAAETPEAAKVMTLLRQRVNDYLDREINLEKEVNKK